MKTLLLAMAWLSQMWTLGCQHTVDAPLRTEARQPMNDSSQTLPMPVEIAGHVRTALAELDQLKVVSHQRVSFVKRTLDPNTDPKSIERSAFAAVTGRPDVVYVDVRICSSMTKDSFDVKMWKEGLSQPATELTLKPSDGVPTITERQWYPVWNKYREAVYPAPQPDGITDWGIQPCLFDEIKIYVCASAEFFKTWLGASWQADSFKSMLAESTHVEMCEYQGEAAFCLTRPCHEKQEANRYRSRVDTFWITQDKQRLLGWRSEGVDIRYGEFVGYLVVDRHYNYRDCNAEIHVSEGNGFPAQW